MECVFHRAGEYDEGCRNSSLLIRTVVASDTPNLYTHMVSRVYVDDMPVDTYETEFGIRYF